MSKRGFLSLGDVSIRFNYADNAIYSRANVFIVFVLSSSAKLGLASTRIDPIQGN
jgi:hypothetical protein